MDGYTNVHGASSLVFQCFPTILSQFLHECSPCHFHWAACLTYWPSLYPIVRAKRNLAKSRLKTPLSNGRRHASECMNQMFDPMQWWTNRKKDKPLILNNFVSKPSTLSSVKVRQAYWNTTDEKRWGTNSCHISATSHQCTIHWSRRSLVNGIANKTRMKLGN